MKKLLIILFLGLSFSSFSQKRYSAKDIFKQESIVWYGVDYTNAKFIGSFSQFKGIGWVNGYDLRDKYFPAWNYLPIKEHEKYNVAKFLKKDKQINDLNSVETLNHEVDPFVLIQQEDYTLEESSLDSMVAKYESVEKNEGIGVVLITEKYDQIQKMASYYIVFFDIASKEILMHDKFSAEPGGAGVKGYWGNTIYETLKQASGKYGKWKRTHRA
jgi:hypothetical protein